MTELVFKSNESSGRIMTDAKSRKQQTPEQREAQRQAFIEAARAAGCSEDEAEFDANLKRVARPKPADATPAETKQDNCNDP